MGLDEKSVKIVDEMIEILSECCDIENRRAGIKAPEDPAILSLCEMIGYGAAIDSAVRQWRKKDNIGAFTTGPCVGTVKYMIEKLESLKNGGEA